jgi:hypothetical protein
LLKFIMYSLTSKKGLVLRAFANGMITKRMFPVCPLDVSTKALANLGRVEGLEVLDALGTIVLIILLTRRTKSPENGPGPCTRLWTTIVSSQDAFEIVHIDPTGLMKPSFLRPRVHR